MEDTAIQTTNVYYPKPDDFEPVDDWPEGHPRHGSNLKRCHAWNSLKGRQCMGIAMTSRNRNVCARHGGKSLVGRDAPGYKHGGYAKYLPKGLVEKYVGFLTDDPMKTLRHSIVLLQTRAGELLERLETGEGESAWTAVKIAVDDIFAAIEDGNEMLMSSALTRLKDAVELHENETEVWDEIRHTFRVITALSAEERQRIIAMQTLYTPEDVMIIADRLDQLMREVFRKYVDPDVAPIAAREMADGIRNAFRFHS